MAHLPPITWNDVATESDVDAAADRLGDRLRAELVGAGNRRIEWLATFAAAWTTVLVDVVRLAP